MKRIPNGIYSPELREQAVRLYETEQLSIVGRKGDCRDNAPIESFWGSLKNELVHHRHYRTRAKVNREIS